VFTMWTLSMSHDFLSAKLFLPFRYGFKTFCSLLCSSIASYIQQTLS
jgi:hypothetical protein